MIAKIMSNNMHAHLDAVFIVIRSASSGLLIIFEDSQNVAYVTTFALWFLSPCKQFATVQSN